VTPTEVSVFCIKVKRKLTINVLEVVFHSKKIWAPQVPQALTKANKASECDKT
jgi:hypothetical protein